MKIECVLTSCNLNPLYSDFIPIVINAWSRIYPEVDVRIILVSSFIPEKLIQYKDNLILYDPPPEINTAFISQNIRLLYPAILSYQEGVLITDIDMIPLNRKYFVDNIKDLGLNKFINYRNCLLELNQLAICYNVAVPKIWAEVFGISSLIDINQNLENMYKKISYDGLSDGLGWYSDQIYLYDQVVNWNKKTENFILLNDAETGFNRLDRSSMPSLDKEMENRISQGFYSDFHMLRPFLDYKKNNENILLLIKKYYLDRNGISRWKYVIRRIVVVFKNL